MNHGSLFSGIGGFDLAAEWMDWNNIFHCEINEFSRKILKYYWPESKSYEDIKNTDFSIYRGKIDIITGGFPCQPYSQAGKRLGKADERHLWPEMLRVIQQVQPRWVVAENVLGIVNWNNGMVFDEVQIDLENEGYSVQSFVLPAAGINAPHRRYRTWFVAYSDNSGTNSNLRNNRNRKEKIEKRKTKLQPEFGKNGKNESITNTNSRRQSRKEYRKKESRWVTKKSCSNDWENFPTTSPIFGGNDGISNKLDGITFPKWRNESIAGYGNAIVPGLALQIFKTIELYGQKNTNT
ncbi:MAG: DNA cytosine methyltransferase [Phycisphaerales bacterium]|nr:DNA cytosine methyltransferase [Phycisphaerales bacterium]